MLDSDQEPSYNLSKNLLLLPRILKLIKDMVDDSTPLQRAERGGGQSSMDIFHLKNVCTPFHRPIGKMLTCTHTALKQIHNIHGSQSKIIHGFGTCFLCIYI